MPALSFFLATTDHPIDDRHPLWNQTLPNQRHGEKQASEPVGTEPLTYARFFSAVARFCESEGWGRLINAASRKLEAPLAKDDLKQVSIFLEKHGAFYHPARVRLRTGNQVLFFVINVAASAKGRKALPKEVKALNQLNKDRPFGWFPRIYDAAFDDPPMFLGDWFESFHEFHLTRKKENGSMKIAVWDGSTEPCLLSPTQANKLYRNASTILTACYDLVSSRQIFPWHHAAGDFVVRIDGQRVETRLITARNYGPLVETEAEPSDEMEIMEALMAFCIHHSIRMRLDRIDGVSSVAWVPDSFLAPIMEGFFQGLDLTARMNGFPESFPELFRLYFNRHKGTDVLSMAHQIKEAIYDRRSEEYEVIDNRLPFHIQKMKGFFSA